MPCVECARLATEHGRLQGVYAKAFDAMFASYVSSRDFTLAKETADDARVDLEVARLEMENHKRNHAKAN